MLLKSVKSMHRLSGLVSRKCLETRPWVWCQLYASWSDIDVLLITRSGRAAYLRTCAIVYFELPIVVIIDSCPADVVADVFLTAKK